jgi:hypothetical protein
MEQYYKLDYKTAFSGGLLRNQNANIVNKSIAIH